MVPSVELRAAFATAKATGDVACIEAFFSLPGVMAQVAASTTDCSASWRSGPPLMLELLDAIHDDHGEILHWFFAAERADAMSIVVTSWMSELIEKAVESSRLAVLDTILSSTIFADKFEDHEKQKLLTGAMLAAVMYSTMDVLDVLVAHGVCGEFTEDDIAERRFDGNFGRGCSEISSRHGAFFVLAGVKLTDIPLHVDQDGVLMSLIELGVDVDSTSLGETLLYAAQEASFELVDTLLKHACFDVDFVDGDGESALMKVGWQDTYSLHWKYKNPPKIARLLLEYGADVHVRDARGITPLHYACESNFPDVARILLENGADPTARSNSGQSPHDEIDLDDIELVYISEIMDLLLEHGADLHTKNQLGESMFDILSASAEGQEYIEARSELIERNTRKRGPRR